MTKQHEVLAAWLSSEICIEGEQTVDASRGCPEMLRDELGRFERYPSKPLVDQLKRVQDQLLRLLMILIRNGGKDLPNDIEVDFAGGRCVGFRV